MAQESSLGGPGLPTPPAVVEGLVRAFGKDKIGETGYDIAATRCCTENEKAEARKRGQSLLYGEMLPDGVSKALHPSRLGQPLIGDGATVLELGMGSGTVAAQIFLQCASVRHVLGVELVRSRYEIAEAAFGRLPAAEPSKYRIQSSQAGDQICIAEAATGRKLEGRCADFFALGLDLVQRADVIFFAVNIPCKLFAQLCERLSKAKEGCRLFTYHRLDTVWWSDVQCPWHQVEVNVPDTDTFATSWSPQGYRRRPATRPSQSGRQCGMKQARPTITTTRRTSSLSGIFLARLGAGPAIGRRSMVPGSLYTCQQDMRSGTRQSAWQTLAGAGLMELLQLSRSNTC